MILLKEIDVMTKCKIGNQILTMLTNNNIAAGDKITITIETTRSGAIKEIEIKEGE